MTGSRSRAQAFEPHGVGKPSWDVLGISKNGGRFYALFEKGTFGKALLSISDSCLVTAAKSVMPGQGRKNKRPTHSHT